MLLQTETVSAAPTAPVGHTFNVLLSNLLSVRAGLANLAKRAARKGLTPASFTEGKAFTQKEHVEREFACSGDVGCPGCTRVTRVPLTIVGDAPHYDGWTFLAALEHLDGENVVRTVPGESIDTKYRTRGPVCDHCRQNRRRNDTYVLRHVDGRTVQVGSTCIDDFLGSADASKLAAAAAYLAAVKGLAEEGCEGFGGGSSGDHTLAEFLPFVAWSVRLEGWTSRTVAREKGCGATADAAFAYLTDRKAREKAGADPTDDDRTLAANAEAWAEALDDASVNAESGDYLHNLRAVARTGLASFRSAGIAGSMIVAYQRAIGKAQARKARAERPNLDAHVGTVGKRETWIVVLDFVTGYETQYGYTTILKFRTAEGATLVWKASSTAIARDDVGKRYSVKGTVKEHGEYNGAKQTMISRCVVTEVK